MKKSQFSYVSLVATALVLLSACSGEQKKTGLEAAPAFTLMDLDSVQHTLAEIEGDVIMLHFWADWCAHCRQEFPELQAAYDSLKGQGFNLVAVNSGQDREITAGIRETYGLTFKMLVDPEKTVTEKFGVKGLPTSFFVDRTGRVLKRHIGWVKRSDIHEIFAGIGPAGQ